MKFATAKSKIFADSFELLNQVASVLRSNPELAKGAHREGQLHRQRSGNAAKNMKLSDARAKSVRDYLVNNAAIPVERIDAVGYGPTKPIASNSTAKGRAQNRRVEFNIVK